MIGGVMATQMEITVREPRRSPVVHRAGAGVVRIGRAADNDVVLDDDGASRHHAEIRLAGGAWEVRDLGSLNGTRVNGDVVSGRRRLRDGDELRLGGASILVRFLGPDGSRVRRDAPTRDAVALDSGTGEPVLLGDSAAMAAIRATSGAFARLDAPVLVTGESGTGKELVARLLHVLSARAPGPFVVVNCPALPGSLLDAELFGVEPGVATGVVARQGRLEMAAGGTLFLDEVGDLEPAAQARLLRFLQDGSVERVGGRSSFKVDARVVSATNRDLDAAMASGAFRPDLYHRLAGATIHLPPLRERREDIPVLARHFLAERWPSAALSAEALAVLEACEFPGNVRELQQAVIVAAAVAEGGTIGIEHLPARLSRAVRSPSRPAPERMHARILAGESFWDVVHAPFLRRQLAREDVVALLEHGRRHAGGSWKALVRLYGIEPEYRRFINFLAHHGLRSEGD